MSKETIKEVQNYPICAIPERGINLETAHHFEVRTAVSQEDGKTPIAYYFPYKKDGKVIGYKKKDLTVDKGSRYHFTAIGQENENTPFVGHIGNGKKLV